LERTRLTVEQATVVDHPVTLSIALVWAVSVLLWVGDLKGAEEHIDRFIARAETHSLGPYHAVGRGYKGQLAVRRGDFACGVESLQSALVDLHAVRYELLTTAFSISIVEGLAAMRRFDEAIICVDDAMKMVKSNGDASYMPELLRVKGNVLLDNGRHAEGESHLMQALELSRRQAAVAWELRATMDLAKRWAACGQGARARESLEPMVRRFKEGLETADVIAAEQLLQSLH
jgi:tetratricopeptide (TPR) repeat protein